KLVGDGRDELGAAAFQPFPLLRPAQADDQPAECQPGGDDPLQTPPAPSVPTGGTHPPGPPLGRTHPPGPPLGGATRSPVPPWRPLGGTSPPAGPGAPHVADGYEHLGAVHE